MLIKLHCFGQQPMSQLKLKNVAKHSLAGMSCVNFNTYNDLPHTAGGIPFSEGTVGSILPFVGQLSLVAWIRVKNGRGEERAL